MGETWDGKPISWWVRKAKGWAKIDWIRHGQWCELSDYESIAMVGLAEAMAKYDPMRGLTCGAFATRTVHGRIIDYVRQVYGTHNRTGESKRTARRGGTPKCWGVFEYCLPRELARYAAPDGYGQVEAAHDLEYVWRSMSPYRRKLLEAWGAGVHAQEWSDKTGVKPGTFDSMVSVTRKRAKEMLCADGW